MERWVTIFYIVSDIVWELLIGYIGFYILAHAIFAIGSKKIQNIESERGKIEKKKEIKKAVRWIYLIWTLLIIAVNLWTSL